jgi:hypothetical protein
MSAIHDPRLAEIVPEQKRPIFVVRLRPEPGVADPVRALRAALKILLRRFGLRCVSAQRDGR